MRLVFDGGPLSICVFCVACLVRMHPACGNSCWCACDMENMKIVALG